ncbi:MAG: carboxypeptidase-like regulatory domain-containing protein, partial [Thermoplasmata archaeon]|nr:carboxypeptidase-like regulatory domain-containing protein [Thermoplasmata archaeon]
MLTVLLVSGFSSLPAGALPSPPTSPERTAPSSLSCPSRTNGALTPSVACTTADPHRHPGPENASSLIDWTQLSGVTPGNVSGAGLAIDSSRAEAVQFGGSRPSGLTNQTLEYNETSNQWTPLQYGPGFPSSAVPSPRTGLAFAADASTGVAVLFGGESNLADGLAVNDTWEFHFANGSWTNVTGTSGPAPREDAAFAIDPAIGIGLLFGGWDTDYQGAGQVTFSDTWEYFLTNHTWMRVTVAPGSGPAALHGSAMAWDPAVGEFDLFGGCYPCSNNIWQFDPTTLTWAEASATAGPLPTPRMQGVWSYDPSLFGDVLFGGTDGVSVFSDTSVYLAGANTWSSQSAAGIPGRFAASADWFNVTGNETLLLTGGTAGTVPFGGAWRLAATASLTVQVVNASDESPIPLASVETGLRAAATTDADGFVNLTDLPSEEVVLNVTAPGYAESLTARWVAPGSSTTVVIGLTGVASATVDAHIRTVTGRPVAGALVNLTAGAHALNRENTSDRFGWANFSFVPAAEGFATAWAPANHTTSVATLFGAGGTVIVNLTLIPLAVLEAHVTGLLPNGTIAPLGNASVALDGSLIGLTGGNGYLNASSTGFGNLLLTASAAYFSTITVAVDLPVSGAIPAAVQLVSAPPADLDLTVLNSQTLVPIPVALINFTDRSPLPTLPPRFSEATARGLLLGPVLAGNYTLTAWSVGYEENTAIPPQWMQPSLIDSLTVLLTPAPKSELDSLILDNATHDPISGASVALVGVETLTSTAAGWANFSGLDAGSYEIVASASGYDSNQTNVPLAAGQTIHRFPINLTRAATGSSPGGQNNLAILPPDAVSVWPLLLLPLAAFALAVLYLTILRAPEAAPVRPTEIPGPASVAAPPPGLWR